MASFRGRRPFRRRARARPNLTWFEDEIVFGDPRQLTPGAITSLARESAVASSIHANLSRDTVFKAHYLNCAVSGSITPGASVAAPGTTVRLCVGLGIGEDESAADGTFQNTGLTNGGPFGAAAKRSNRYFAICCVDIPLGNWLADNAQDQVTSYAQGDRGRHTIWVNRNRTAFNWNFWCHIKSARKLEGSAPVLPFLALAAQVDDAASMNDTSLAIGTRRLQVRSVAMFPRGA